MASSTGNPTPGDQHANIGGGNPHHHQRNHAIARVASAHGPRDSILSFQHHHQHQQQSVAQQPPHYHRHHSPSPLVVGSTGTSRLIGGSAPPALGSGVVGQSPISLPPPPQYEQAVAAAAAAVNEDVDSGTGNAGPGSNLAKFTTRRSPESRAPIQAVLPMQPSLMREVIPSPTSIPDECQVVKQLVREMASGQLSMLGNAASGFPVVEGAIAATQGAMNVLSAHPPPPTYLQHQQQFQTQQQPVRQQHTSSNTSIQQQKTHQHASASSTAHPLLDSGSNATTTSDSVHNTTHAVSSPKDTNPGGQRMSLSHPDLSRLQNLQLSTWHGQMNSANVDDATSGMTSSGTGGAMLHAAAALNAMAASFTASSGSSQPAPMRIQQRPVLTPQQHQQQQLLLQQQQQQQQQFQSNTAMGQQNLSAKMLEHGVSYYPGHSASAVGNAQFGNRLANMHNQTSMQGATFTTPHQYEAGRAYELASYVQSTASNAMVAGMHPQSVLAGANTASASGSMVLSSGHESMSRSSMEAYEADLEANAFTRMINLLKEENKNLRTELDAYMKKTFKLQQLELQYQKLYREYEDLVRRQDKREELEQQMTTRLRQENARLRDLNVHLRDQLENSLAQMAHLHADESEDAELRHELMRREMMMAQLITQNKELVACKERQEIELEAQRQTLDDQRNHIQILDKALTNAQERNLRLDEECKKKSMYVQRAEQLQRTVQTLQEAIQKNEENHKRVRAQLEKELAQLQLQKKDTQVKKTSSSRCLQDFDDTLAKLKRELRDKDDQLSGLQQEVVRWQNMYYDELKKRQTALDEAADSKDARIRILEETNDKTEKMRESAQVEAKRYLEDLRSLKAKISEYDSKIQGLEARLAEKDAMINVLRRRQNAPFGDTSINARSAEATLSEPYNHHETKQRLEAVRRRLLQSPSPSRYTPRLYQRHGHKFTSIDASFGLDDNDYGSLGRPGRRSKVSSSTHTGSTAAGGNSLATGNSTAATSDMSAGRLQHSRTQSSCDSYLSPSSASGAAGVSSSALAAFKQREIFTLPTRRSRTKLLTTEQVKSVRPRSADEHLLNRVESVENTDVNFVEEKSAAKPNNMVNAPVSDSPSINVEAGEDNGEELWHV